MEKTKNRSHQEIIWMTDQEAFEAERCLYQLYCATDRDKVAAYSGYLKDFILYLRHGIQTSAIRELKLEGLEGIS
jgi:hypothetical protein